MAKKKQKITFNSIAGPCSGFYYVSRVADCCGIAEFEGLKAENAEGQASALARYMKYGNTNQIVFTDICTKTGRATGCWKEAKKLAYKGPVTYNPNSGNHVRHYTITRDQIVKLYKTKAK